MSIVITMLLQARFRGWEEEKKRQKATVRTATVRTAPERERKEEEDENNPGPTMSDISDPPCYDMVRKGANEEDVWELYKRRYGDHGYISR